MGRFTSILAIVLVGAMCLPAGAQAAFGLSDFDVTFTDEDGSSTVRAGTHPFAFTTSLDMNSDGNEPEGRLRELFLDLPPGLVLSATAAPSCEEADFKTVTEGKSDCSDATAVGVFQAASGEPADWTTAPVYNLVPPPGVFMRLGFRLAGAANVAIDFELSPEPPYRLVAGVSEIPEAIELFAAKLQLWGVPASPMHDDLRGFCAIEGEGQCPVSLTERPLLTLPTSCEGPQETFYEALPWEGDEDRGGALTHDDAGESSGFLGCHELGFDPVMSAAPTTEAAQSPTGLDVSIVLNGAGFANPGGRVQSQIRGLGLAFPGGMSAGSSLASASGSCTEAGLEAETPEEVPGEGCPQTSKVGTVQAESPLVEGRVIHGAIYRATPHENFAEAAMALYVVLKNPELGIVIRQPVSLEADPQTGELIAIANTMPQLPFSQLQLHLDDGSLGSPTHCDDYEVEAYFLTWSSEDLFKLISPFAIVSGPNGGACTTGDDEAQPGEVTGSLPSAAAAAPAATGPGNPQRRASPKHRCRKGTHRVRRHGKTRCIKKQRHRPHKHRRNR